MNCKLSFGAPNASRFVSGSILVLILGASLLSACETRKEVVAQHEDRLAAAGFVVRPANTPERQAMLDRLPAARFVQRTRGDSVTYVYGDPLVCNCLYVGTQQAYDQYKRDRQDRHLADQQLTTAQMYADSGWEWQRWELGGVGYEFGPGMGW